jgi:hypothetical protein
MRRFIAVVLAMLASVILYVGVFSVVHRPLTVGEIAPLLAIKSAYAKSLPSPKLIVLAGSNGRFSHRCAVITAASGWPCANLSIAVGIGLDFMLDRLEPLLQPGDVVYLPLEYGQYEASAQEMAAGEQNAVLVHDMQAELWQLPANQIARAYASFDLPFLVHGLIEMGLAERGFSRRISLASLTPQGDERGHTAAQGQRYAAFLAASRLDLHPLPARSHALDVLDAFLDRARARGALVVGGLPTTPDNVALDLAGISRLKQDFERHDHAFLELPNQSQYPLGCFFDTLYHLNEACQLKHSELVGQALATLLNARMQAAAVPGAHRAPNKGT